MSHKTLALFIAASIFFQSGCIKHSAVPSELRPEQAVELVLSRYREAVRKQDARAIAALFEQDASIAHDHQTPIAGRDNIRSFLESFAAYKVLSYDIEAKSTDVEADTAAQAGDYRQTVRLPDGKTVTVQGSFRVRFRRDHGQWLIESMRTASSQ